MTIRIILNNYTLLKNNKEHFWFQKSCKLGIYNMVYYKLMTVLYVRETGLLMYMYLKIVSTLTTNVKMDMTEPVH